MSVTINASTSSGLVQTADTSGTVEIQSNGTTKFTVASTGAYGQITSGTAVASTSGTSIDFTGIPSWAKRITVMFSGVSGSGTSSFQIQLGYSGGIETTGYVSACNVLTGTSVTSTSGMCVTANAVAANNYSGQAIICLFGSNFWTLNSNMVRNDAAAIFVGTGYKTTTGTLDRVRITTFNGTDTFDAGTINIQYEG